ncbi:DUF2510 domain-containing protein [Curtobacterium aurantiacum]|uniref:DUF2510 domain-containing protein n=1 Tax=Curtobacterium aurantiacum TaxID=3236919 RepID=A0ABS5VH49_9MICO|nr:DUF2510 domain-containing protein [Curtobacterium flaccumfaciens]MBT1545998.1 DUF2510 domain-containing protein [Curtobacterium flaccumfaciens pv. flaccumfaciens]MBT1588824.1 DUF2510 domain-containing protein [Curtobacterium flaccumfaciens pv. flaccumfaciens]MBT1679507.1 DUF2510 domain-containing protein [Curtobacterium flaccumfaciens pv. flaccumfaciens]
MTLPAAGWFPDPQDARRLRWWDGRTWGAATRVPAAAAEPVTPIVVAPAGPSFSVQTAAIRTHAWASGGGRDRRLSVLTVLAVLLALTSILINPLGACSVLALVCGLVGVVHPGATGGWRVLARSASASAIVVAVATGAVAASVQLHLF